VSHQASTSFIHHPLSGPSTSSAHASGSGLGGYATEDPLEARVANISMEIAAAIAQAQAEDRAQEPEESDDGLESEEVDDTGTGRTRRVRSGKDTADTRAGQDIEGGEEDAEGELDEDPGEGEDEEEFPSPLRGRKGKEPAAGYKRKR